MAFLSIISPCREKYNTLKNFGYKKYKMFATAVRQPKKALNLWFKAFYGLFDVYLLQKDISDRFNLFSGHSDILNQKIHDFFLQCIPTFIL